MRRQKWRQVEIDVFKNGRQKWRNSFVLLIFGIVLFINPDSKKSLEERGLL